MSFLFQSCDQNAHVGIKRSEDSGPRITTNTTIQASPLISVIEVDQYNPQNKQIILSLNLSRAAGDLQASSFDIVNANIISLEKISARAYKIEIEPSCDLSCTIELQLLAAQVKAVDDGTTNDESNRINLVYDEAAPGVVLSSNAPSPANQESYTINIQFSEEIKDPNEARCLVSAGSIVEGSFQVSGQSASFIVKPAQCASTCQKISVYCEAGFVVDESGNTSTASNVVTIHHDDQGPKAQLASKVKEVRSIDDIEITLSFNEAINAASLSVDDLACANCVISSAIVDNGSYFSFTITPQSVETVKVSIKDQGVEDLVGNLSVGSSSLIIPGVGFFSVTNGVAGLVKDSIEVKFEGSTGAQSIELTPSKPSFTVPGLMDKTSYKISLVKVPESHTCSFKNGTNIVTGQIKGSNVVVSSIQCKVKKFKVAGKITTDGAFGKLGIIAEVNGQKAYEYTALSAGDYSTAVNYGDDVKIILNQEAVDGSFQCSIKNENGVILNIQQDYTEVDIHCARKNVKIIADISGLPGTTPIAFYANSILQGAWSNGQYVFAHPVGTALASGVKKVPAGYECKVSPSKIDIVSESEKIEVVCTDVGFKLSGKIIGLDEDDLIKLKLNDGLPSAFGNGGFGFNVPAHGNYALFIVDSGDYKCVFPNNDSEGHITAPKSDIVVSCKKELADFFITKFEVQGEPGKTSALFGSQTNLPSSIEVKYYPVGSTSSLNYINAVVSTDKIFKLENLTPNTLYEAQLIATDANNRVREQKLQFKTAEKVPVIVDGMNCTYDGDKKVALKKIVIGGDDDFVGAEYGEIVTLNGQVWEGKSGVASPAMVQSLNDHYYKDCVKNYGESSTRCNHTMFDRLRKRFDEGGIDRHVAAEINLQEYKGKTVCASVMYRGKDLNSLFYTDAASVTISPYNTWRDYTSTTPNYNIAAAWKRFCDNGCVDWREKPNFVISFDFQTLKYTNPDGLEAPLLDYFNRIGSLGFYVSDDTNVDFVEIMLLVEEE